MTYKNTQTGSVRVVIVIFAVVIIVGVVYYSTVVSRPKEVAKESTTDTSEIAHSLQQKTISSTPTQTEQNASRDVPATERVHPKVFVDVVKKRPNGKDCYDGTLNVFFVSEERKQNVYDINFYTCAPANKGFLSEDGGWFGQDIGISRLSLRYATSSSERFIGVYIQDNANDAGAWSHSETFIPFDNPKAQYVLSGSGFDELSAVNFQNTQGEYEFSGAPIRDGECDSTKPIRDYKGSVSRNNYQIFINKKPVLSLPNFQLGCTEQSQESNAYFEGNYLSAEYDWGGTIPSVKMRIGDTDDYVFTFSLDDPISTFKQLLK